MISARTSSLRRLQRLRSNVIRFRSETSETVESKGEEFSENAFESFQKLICRIQVIPALLAVLEDLGHPRVAAHAGAALVNFSEDAPSNVMQAYLDPIMMKLLWVLEQTFNQVSILCFHLPFLLITVLFFSWWRKERNSSWSKSSLLSLQ